MSNTHIEHCPGCHHPAPENVRDGRCSRCRGLTGGQRAAWRMLHRARTREALADLETREG